MKMKRLYLYALVIIFSLSLFACSNTQTEKVGVNPQIPILMYHHFEEEGINSLTVHPKNFEEQMKAIKEEGYETITFGQLIAFLNHEGTLPEKPILITMDDGYESNYKYAYPILKELNMKAAIFLITSKIRREEEKHLEDGLPNLSWEQIHEMSESGLIEFHSHTHDSHKKYMKGKKEVAYLAGPIVKENGELETQEEYEQRIMNDLLLSKKLIEKNIGQPVTVLCYPYGAYSETSEKVAKEVGFLATVTVNKGIISKGNSPFLLKRINVDGSYTAWDLIDVLNNELSE
ncbi:polysaccharide deacetylase family protein [Bhargavaea massiliensis]